MLDLYSTEFDMSQVTPPLHIHTPLLFKQQNGCTVGLKMEGLQPSGSFKLRGVGYACQTHAKRGVKRFWASSGGNAGLAVAYAGKQLRVPVSVVVPETTSERAKQLIQAQDANVIVYGRVWDEAHAYATEQLKTNEVYIHPFDDPLLWQGHSSLVDEVISESFEPDAVVVSVGGGGLLGGVLLGLEKNNLRNIPVYAVETEGSDCLAQAIKAGKPIRLSQLNSIATSLGAKQISAQVFDWVQQREIHSIRVSDQTALSACFSFLDDYRLLVEPACGAALSMIYTMSETLKAYRRVLCVVCGGVGITLKQMQTYAEQLGNQTQS
jgi:L-serine/L-threonine ammonia-lyase